MITPKTGKLKKVVVSICGHTVLVFASCKILAPQYTSKNGYSHLLLLLKKVFFRFRPVTALSPLGKEGVSLTAAAIQMNFDQAGGDYDVEKMTSEFHKMTLQSDIPMEIDQPNESDMEIDTDEEIEDMDCDDGDSDFHENNCESKFLMLLWIFLMVIFCYENVGFSILKTFSYFV